MRIGRWQVRLAATYLAGPAQSEDDVGRLEAGGEEQRPVSGAGEQSGGAAPDPVDAGVGSGALSHLRVLDLTSAAAAYAGKLLADLGADVIKVEPPGGDPARCEAPLGPDGESLPFRYENANKRSVVLDVSVAEDAEALRRLAEEADLL